MDANGDGKADPTRDTSVPPDGILDKAFCDDAPHQCDKTMTDIIPIWEGGRNLALMSASSRKIFTWVDLDNNKLVKNISHTDWCRGGGVYFIRQHQCEQAHGLSQSEWRPGSVYGREHR